MTPPDGTGALLAPGGDVEGDLEGAGARVGDLIALGELIASCEWFHLRVSRSLITIAQLAAGQLSADPLRVAVVKSFLVEPLPEHLADEEQGLVPRVRALQPPEEVAAALVEVQAGIHEIRDAVSAILPTLTDLAAGRRLAVGDLPLLRTHVQRLQAALAEHVRLEEEVVFPWVRERTRSPRGDSP